MYKFYIRNYNDSDGTFKSDTEELIYEVPVGSGDIDSVFLDPVIKNEMGKAGSLEFSVEPINPWYNCWVQMRTIIRVSYESKTIFRGRVLTIDNNLLGQRKIHCEGDLAFLLDTMQEPVKENQRTEKALSTYLQEVIDAHNSQVSEGANQYKNIYLGYVPGKYVDTISSGQRIKDDTKKWGSDGWETTWAALEKIEKEEGGYFRTRYSSSTNRVYLDWLDAYFDANLNGQDIEIGENMIDLSSSSEVDNIFTALIPIGTKNGEEIYIDGYKPEVHGENNKRILVPQLLDVFTRAQLDEGYHSMEEYRDAVTKYGIIYKVEKFNNADTQEKLWDYATDWMKNNYYGGITSFSISAFDMHHVDSKEQQFFVGDRVKVIYPDMNSFTDNKRRTIEREMTITQISYYPHDPDKNQYTIGIPSSILNKTYGTASNSKGGGGGSKIPNDDNNDDILAKTWRQRFDQLDYLVWQNLYNRQWNPNDDIVQGFLKLNPGEDGQKLAGTIFNAAAFTTKQIVSGSPFAPSIPSIMLNNGKITIMQGTCFEQDIKIPDDQLVLFKSLVFDGTKNGMQIYNDVPFVPDTENPGKMKPKFLPTGPIGLLAGDINKGLTLDGYKDGHGPNDPEPKKGFSLDSFEGLFKGSFLKLGEDANDPIIDPDLKDKLGNLVPPELQDKFKILLNGNTGEVDVGKEPEDKENPKPGVNKWVVKINTPITYKDRNGNTQTRTGAISADDLQLREVDSFATQFILAQEILAEAITTQNLNANIAKISEALINHLQTRTFTARTIGANNIYADTSFALGGTYYSGSSFRFVTDVTLENGELHVTKCPTTTFFIASN